MSIVGAWVGRVVGQVGRAGEVLGGAIVAVIDAAMSPRRAGRHVEDSTYKIDYDLEEAVYALECVVDVVDLYGEDEEELLVDNTWSVVEQVWEYSEREWEEAEREWDRRTR